MTALLDLPWPLVVPVPRRRKFEFSHFRAGLFKRTARAGPVLLMKVVKYGPKCGTCARWIYLLGKLKNDGSAKWAFFAIKLNRHRPGVTSLLARTAAWFCCSNSTRWKNQFVWFSSCMVIRPQSGALNFPSAIFVSVLFETTSSMWPCSPQTRTRSQTFLTRRSPQCQSTVLRCRMGWKFIGSLS